MVKGTSIFRRRRDVPSTMAIAMSCPAKLHASGCPAASGTVFVAFWQFSRPTQNPLSDLIAAS
jgi:hypothetical protein